MRFVITILAIGVLALSQNAYAAGHHMGATLLLALGALLVFSVGYLLGFQIGEETKTMPPDEEIEAGGGE